MSEILLIALLAGVLSLDTTAFGQFMVSRPIVSASIIGYMLGNVYAGVWIGITIELIWIAALPMGAAIPLDTTAIAVLSMCWGLAIHPYDSAALILALALAVGASVIFVRADIFVRYLNVKIMRWVEAGIKDGKEDRIDMGIYAGLALFFLKAFVLYLLLIYPGREIVKFVYYYLDEKMLEGFRIAWFLLPVLGMGFMLVSFRDGKFPCNRFNTTGKQK